MNIPWAIPDLQDEDRQAAVDVLQSNWLSMGSVVKKFEKSLSTYLNIRYAIATNNGTSALDIALKCLDIKKGDEVIIPALTYIATGNGVLYNNATPIFVDIDETLNIDPLKIEEKITDKTKAIINIDFGGNANDYTLLEKISNTYDIPLVVDGAHSLGAAFKDKKCCSHGIINTTSFHAAKILTTIEGGMIFTNNTEIYEKSLQIRNQGESTKYIHNYLGNNYRMTDFIAAIGLNQVQRLDNTIKMRRKKAQFYIENLKNVKFPKTLPNTVNCYLFFPILTDKRDQLYTYLQKEGIETRITFPIPIYEQPIFKKYKTNRCINTEKTSQTILSLPIYTKISSEKQEYIVRKINDYLK
jgi:perosamine synthetase